MSDLNPHGVERMKKKMSAIFRGHGLEITIDANKKYVEFLDIYMDLEKEEYGPFSKPNDTPIYVDASSNHPPKVIENIPMGINRRLSTISATKEIFDKAAPVYQAALKKSGHTVTYIMTQAHTQMMRGKSKQKHAKGPLFGVTPPIPKQ